MTRASHNDPDNADPEVRSWFDDWGMITLMVVIAPVLWLTIKARELEYAYMLGNPSWRLDPASDLGIPTVHAALLSVLIPVIAAYAIYVNGARRQLERVVFEEAGKVNDIRPPLVLSPSSRLPPSGRFTPDERLELTTRFQRILVYAGRDVPDSASSQGEEALDTLMVVLSTDPMAPRVRRLGEDNFQIVEERLRFRTIREINDWLGAIGTVGVICAIAVNRAQRFSELVAAAAQTNNWPANNSQQMLHGLLQAAQQLLELQSSLARKLNELEDHSKRLPGRVGVLVSVALALAAFTTGVAIPMALTGIGPLVAVWVPLSAYVGIFAFLSWLIWRA